MPETKDDKSVKEEIKDLFGDMKADVKADVKEEVMEKVEEALEKEREKREKKLGVYNEDKDVDVEKRNKEFMKELQDVAKRGKVINPKYTAKDTETTSAQSEVIDDELSAEIMSADEDYGVARQLFRTHELTKHSYDANELTTDVSVGWVSEAGTISTTAFAVTQNTLELKKLAAIVIMSNELLEDSEIDLRSFLVDRIGLAFASEEDRVFLAGNSDDGDTPIDGLLYDDSIQVYKMDSGNTAAGDVNPTALAEMQEEVPRSVRQNGTYLMSLSVFNVIRTLEDSDNNPIYKDVAGEGPDTIHGDPVVISDQMPTTSDVSSFDDFILYGDFERGTVLGHKGGVRIDSAISGVVTDTDSTDQNLFETDQTAIRFIERVGYAYVLSDTLVKLRTNSS